MNLELALPAPLAPIAPALAWLMQPSVLAAATAASLALFVASLILLPRALCALPEDWLLQPPPDPAAERERWRRHPWRFLLRNLMALLLILAGVAMLVLPGQGLLTILVGVGVSDLPGRRRALRAVAFQRGVLAVIDAVRRRGGQRPLLHPGGGPKPGAHP